MQPSQPRLSMLMKVEKEGNLEVPVSAAVVSLVQGGTTSLENSIFFSKAE